MNLSPSFARTARLLVLVTALLALLPASLAAAPVADSGAAASIVGEVFFDGNISRMREPMERGIKNAQVRLYDAEGLFVREMMTDAEGYYIFDNLAVGTYQLQITAPQGYVIGDNGSITVHLAEINGLPIYSTSARFGVFVPVVSR
ncbi:MAG: carboxypeptidase regulatory-like domain-containing protein [Caldilineaceae bacterium]|nr:carboxypeptidase regulatory-like domain-containing protein [Caldilineaceae bacterium]